MKKPLTVKQRAHLKKLRQHYAVSEDSAISIFDTIADRDLLSPLTLNNLHDLGLVGRRVATPHRGGTLILHWLTHEGCKAEAELWQ